MYKRQDNRRVIQPVNDADHCCQTGRFGPSPRGLGVLPDDVSYNGLVLPFAYPPLALWVGALLTKLGFDSLGVVRTMPILMSIGYVVLFALVLLRSGRSRRNPEPERSRAPSSSPGFEVIRSVVLGSAPLGRKSLR